jgi:hypothetical protein
MEQKIEEGGSKSMDSNKWRLEKIKSVRFSPEVCEMLEKEIAVRKTTLSKYLRYAAIIQMKHNKPPQKEAA